MTIEFLPATRAASKARIALTGPSGAGKTYTGLTIAHRLAEIEGGRLAVIDTERGKSQLYKGLNGWDFDVYTPQTYSPLSLVEILGVVAGGGWPVCFLDSWSHYWSGVDGMLELVDRKGKANGNFGGWKEARPDERRMIDALVSAPFHLVVTLRVKTEYVVEENSKGKQAPRKIGLKPDQRDNMEYEFDVIGDMDADTNFTVSKTRIPPLQGHVINKPGPEVADTILDWLSDGEDVPGPLAYRAEALSPDATFDGLKVLFDKVGQLGLKGAPVLDEHGKPTILGDLIVARGRELQPARGAA